MPARSPRSSLLAVTVDAVDPEAVAAFWAEVLGVAVVDPAPDHPWVVLADPEGTVFCLLGPDA